MKCKWSDHEEVVSIRTDPKGKGLIYGIKDTNLGIWRSHEPLTNYNAWTKDHTARAMFTSHRAAKADMKAIWNWRSQPSGTRPPDCGCAVCDETYMPMAPNPPE